MPPATVEVHCPETSKQTFRNSTGSVSCGGCQRIKTGIMLKVCQPWICLCICFCACVHVHSHLFLFRHVGATQLGAPCSWIQMLRIHMRCLLSIYFPMFGSACGFRPRSLHMLKSLWYSFIATHRYVVLLPFE